MIIILSQRITPGQKTRLQEFLSSRGYQVRDLEGLGAPAMGAAGEGLDESSVLSLPGIDRILSTGRRFKLASRDFQKEDTVISLGPIKIGGGRISLSAGPVLADSIEALSPLVPRLRDAGASIFHADVFKSRSSPYSYGGLGEKALPWVKELAASQGLPLVTEVHTLDQVAAAVPYADAFSIPGTQMKNSDLLKACAQAGKPVFLRRSLGADLEDWLLAAESLLSQGLTSVILVESGIRSSEKLERKTLDLSGVAVLRELTHLPVFVHPGSALPRPEAIPALALASLSAGAQGLILDVALTPENQVLGASQTLVPEAFEKLMSDIKALAAVQGRELTRIPKRPEGLGNTGPQGLYTQDPGRRVRAAFQGEHGAYSEMAVFQVFPKDKSEAVPYKTFREVFSAVLDGDVDFGVVPVENALAGSINDNYDLLLQFPDLHIVGETQVRIEHNLIVIPGTKAEQIKKVLSHPQGLGQSAAFLDSHPEWERISFYDTAGSVAHIAETKDSSLAAIASAEAARVYAMEILVPGVETNHRNFTRFFVLAPLNAVPLGMGAKASLVFSTPDESGALARCLNLLALHGLNLKRLESRPIAGRPWAYTFYVDVEMPRDPSTFSLALEELGDITEELRVLGIYPTNIL